MKLPFERLNTVGLVEKAKYRIQGRWLDSLWSNISEHRTNENGMPQGYMSTFEYSEHHMSLCRGKKILADLGRARPWSP